jgi:hypothetical protein
MRCGSTVRCTPPPSCHTCDLATGRPLHGQEVPRTRQQLQLLSHVPQPQLLQQAPQIASCNVESPTWKKSCLSPSKRTRTLHRNGTFTSANCVRSSCCVSVRGSRSGGISCRPLRTFCTQRQKRRGRRHARLHRHPWRARTEQTTLLVCKRQHRHELGELRLLSGSMLGSVWQRLTC